MGSQIVLVDAQTGQPYRAGGTQDASGNTVTTASPFLAGTDRSGNTSGTAGTSTQLAPANAQRRGLNVQNISANPMGINEVGGAASIGSPGTYTVPGGGTINIRTNRAVSVVSATATQPYTATEY